MPTTLPEAGWYPDPEGGTRLRWWNGDDWSDHFRGRGHEATRPSDTGVGDIAAGTVGSVRGRTGSSAELDRIVDTVRSTTQEEMRRAVSSLENTARGGIDRMVGEVRTQASNMTPLISDSVTNLAKWFRRAIILAVLLGILWFVLQVALNVGTAELIDDIVDGISDAFDDESGG